ncbi:MAG: hypothetical protein ABIE36_00040 [Candidatus Diapherotrites archaeon]
MAKIRKDITKDGKLSISFKKDKDIEKFLGLTNEEIDRRKAELRENIPTFPGISYLETRAKKFSVQPWPFISYLAYWAPDKLKDGLEGYKVYDGAENYHAIIEQLKEEYIIWEVISDLKKEHPNRF